MSANGGEYKKGLNREILSAAPSALYQMLKCKAEEAGIECVEIDTRKVKPSQTCHGCGRQEKKSLTMRMHFCACGIACTRDENAAKVNLNSALFGNATGREPAGLWRINVGFSDEARNSIYSRLGGLDGCSSWPLKGPSSRPEAVGNAARNVWAREFAVLA